MPRIAVEPLGKKESFPAVSVTEMERIKVCALFISRAPWIVRSPIPFADEKFLSKRQASFGFLQSFCNPVVRNLPMHRNGE